MPQDITIELFDYIMNDRTPPQWLHHSYPSSGSLPLYLSDLQERVAYINSLLQQDVQTLQCFWVPGFFNQKRLFSLLLHHSARTKQLPLDSICFKYKATSLAESVSDSSDRSKIEQKLQKASQKQELFIYGLMS